MMMTYIKLLLTFILIANQNVNGRVLKEIIDVLIANPHTRFMIKHALMKWERFGSKGLSRLPPLMGPSNQYEQPMMTLIPMPPPSPPPNDRDDSDDEGYLQPQPFILNDKSLQELSSGFPWRAYRERGNHQPRVQWKTNQSPVYSRFEAAPPQAKPNYLQQTAKYVDTRPSGLALEVNGDMKALIPPVADPWRKPADDLSDSPPLVPPSYYQPPPQPYYQPPPAPTAGLFNNDNEETMKGGPLSDSMFRKKREIIRELKSLFTVLFGGEMGGVGLIKRHHRRLRFARGGKKAKIGKKNQKKSTVARVNALKKLHRPSRRVMLYKRLIGDLNDLIALEIRKNNGRDKVGGVKSFVTKLIKTIPSNETEET